MVLTDDCRLVGCLRACTIVQTTVVYNISLCHLQIILKTTSTLAVFLHISINSSSMYNVLCFSCYSQLLHKRQSNFLYSLSPSHHFVSYISRFTDNQCHNIVHALKHKLSRPMRLRCEKQSKVCITTQLAVADVSDARLSGRPCCYLPARGLQMR